LASRYMRTFDHSPARIFWCTAIVFPLVAVLVLTSPVAYGIAPDSAEVKAMTERALAWLETQDDDRLGGKCLIGLSFYKAGRPLSHAKIAAAKNACQSAISGSMSDMDNYSAGLALVFLLETDPDRNRSLAYRYVQEILRRQRRMGGWGYPETATGDTSQTQ